MAEISTNSGKINVSAGQNTVNVGVTKDYSLYYAQLSKDWATKTNGLVNNEDYSSKYYAQLSKDWATNSENNLNAVISQHEQITSEITQAREDISTDLSGALLDIETSKNAGLTAINNAKTSGVTAVNTVKADSVSAVQKAQTTAETSIKSLQTSAEKSVKTGIANIETSKKNAISDITTAGTEQVANIKQTGFYMQDDKLYYINSDGETKEFKSGSVTALFDVVEKDHILTFKESNGLAQLGTYVYKTGVAGSRYGYPTFYNQCVKEMQAGTPTQTQLGDNTVTLYKNDNGHIFYDISNKDTIDTWYNTYGVAWYYGVDTVNKRIFLPRNDWFTQNGSTTEVGKFVEAGLPNITGGNLFYEAGFTNFEGAIYNSGTGQGSKGSMDNDNPVGKFDASKSNAIYGKSTTVQPNSVKKIFYMCVGNTDVESAITDVVDITTSENDTIPLGWSTYQSVGTPSSAFLASLGQQNSGTLYPKFYNDFSAKIGQKFGAGIIKEAHTVYDPSKFTVVGNPTITSDGIASGFSASNYISLDTAILDTSRPWVININYHSSKQPVSIERIVGFAKDDLGLVVAPSVKGFSLRMGGIDIPFPSSYKQDTNYQLSFGWDMSQYFLIVNGKKQISKSTKALMPSYFYLGFKTGGTPEEHVKGSIDLSKFSITVDGEEVFKGTKTVMPADVTDYDLVINQDDQTFRLPLLNGDESLPDNSSDKITTQIFNSSHPYTATERVFVTGSTLTSGGGSAYFSHVLLNGKVIAREEGDFANFQLILNKGDILTTTGTASDANAQINIAPVVGNGTLYYKVSNAVQNLELLDVAEVTTALASKVDTSNTQWATNACMPDYSAGISVTYPLSSNPYTAPCNGMLCPWGKPSNTAIRPIINGVKQEYLRLGELSGSSGGYQGRSIYLSKGDVMYFDESYSVLNGCTFYPLKGAK